MAWTNGSRLRLWRDTERGILAGVCAGIADYIGVEPVAVRVACIAGLFFFTLPTAAGYVLLAMVLRPKPATLYESREEETFWRGVNAAPSDTMQSLRRKFGDLEERLRHIEGQVASGDFELHRKFRDLGQ
jgi:phage shock protein C